jgi:dethiobiotin synthetase
MTRFFVTATGTDIGKSFITAALVRSARRLGHSVAAFKPLVSGFDPNDWANSDPGVLLAAQGLPPTELDRLAPFRFTAPLSPDMAAAREGRSVDVAGLIQFSRQALQGPEEIVLIEGVGGVMVPLDATHTVLDWIKALEIPSLLVAGSYLGTISHTLTALTVMDAAGCPVRAVIISESVESPVPLEETAETIQRFAPDTPILIVRRHQTAEDVAELDALLA